MVDLNSVQQAGNAIINEGGKITVANIRRKLIELYGYAGNNNDLAPVVKEYKKNIRTQSRGTDIDIATANAIKESLTKDMPVSLEANSSRFIKLMYREIYDAVESEISIDRIKQLELENEVLRNQIEEYPKLKLKYELLENNYQQAIKELIETNRMLEMQKVSDGEAKVEEMERINTLYEESVQEIANLKASAEYATQRKNQFSNLNADLRASVDEKNNRISELEEALMLLSSDRNTDSSERETQLENRVVEMSEEITRLKSENRHKSIAKNTLNEFINAEKLGNEIANNKSKFAKTINKFFKHLDNNYKD